MTQFSTYSVLLLSVIVLFSISNNFCFCFYPKLLNVSKAQLDSETWAPAGATWYGPANGGGSDGGACGYKTAVESAPFSLMVSAGGPSIYKSGKGCGTCYQVKCSKNVNPKCSEKPVTVVITDECSGCTSESVHFDLSGAAFGAMADSSQNEQLRNAGVLQIQYRRVECNYPGTKVTFNVDSGSNPSYFAVLVEFEDADGDLSALELQQATQSSSNQWMPLVQSWGAVWKLDAGSTLTAPFSLRLTAADSGKTLVAKNVIPAGWQAGLTYRSVVNFDV